MRPEIVDLLGVLGNLVVRRCWATLKCFPLFKTSSKIMICERVPVPTIASSMRVTARSCSSRWRSGVS